MATKQAVNKQTDPAVKPAVKLAVKRVRNVVPDSIDLRDRPYIPSIMVIPAEVLSPEDRLPVLSQGETNACTGFALASVICHLQSKAKRLPPKYDVSPYMLYSMARRYDEFPGAPDVDTGSSLRGAMKGWYKHGACALDLWPEFEMPRPVAEDATASDDWWLDAVRRPLGSYYRVDSRSITDMQVALNEIGVLYASAAVHSGWEEGMNVKQKAKSDLWTIPQQKALPSDGAHAFAIVGYTRQGFIVHNSYDTGWGTQGRAVLTYDDWLENAMDCWVAQLGVVTELHLEIASSKSLRMQAGSVRLASDSNLRSHEIGPFIVDMANNGQLSNTGDFRTQDSDLDALVNQQIATARTQWGLQPSDVIDIAIYAHGGLTSENDAADAAARWIPALFDAHIFPIFLMWETDLMSTLQDRTADLLAGQARAAGGIFDSAKTWWNIRLEKLLNVPGTMIWGEMKKNADAISGTPGSGGIKLFDACMKSSNFTDLSKVRLHLIGHSAGAIVHSLIIQRLCAKGWKFETVNFMAPAVRVDSFVAEVLPAIQSGAVRAYNQFSLSDDVETKDHTCEKILGYERSLLYLVSQSFEHGVITPILGMETYFDTEIASLNLPNVKLITSPGPQAGSLTHGGFDIDPLTMKSVVALIASTKV